MNTGFWKNKKVLVTGHTGFKGSWICLWLQKLGSHVVGYSLGPPTNPSLFNKAKVADGMSSIKGDIRNLDHFQSTIKKFKPEIVIHMAAQPLVRYSYENPIETYSTNVMGTVNLFEAIRKVGGVRVVVNITSDKCYENKEWLWGYRESEPMGGYDPYSSSKGCAELVTAAYINSYFNSENYSHHGVAIASARAGNVIGGGDWADDRLIPDIIRAHMENRNVTIRNPDAIRPWQHVLEPLHGYLNLAQKLWEDGVSYSGAWNFGPNDEDAKPVSWIVNHITKSWGGEVAWVLEKNEQPHEANYLKLDCSKAKIRLDWRPIWDLVTTLDNVVAWYRADQNNENVHDMTFKQIDTFSNLLTNNHRTVK